jgi:DNA-binding transcriptional LysR family regulator
MYDWAEFRHFRYLLTVLEKQGFRAAAEYLYTTQPNLSIQARSFQENASIRLFQRSKNGRIRPTETGRAFIALARLLLETRDQVIDALIEIDRGIAGRLRFGCSAHVDPALFRSALSFHRELLPSCSIVPMYGDTLQLAEEVALGALDAALITLPLQHTELCIEPLKSERLVVCIRRDDPLASKHSLTAHDLKDRLAILHDPQRHPSIHSKLVELLSDAGLRLQEFARSSNLFEMLMLVKDGFGFALVREGMMLEPELITRPIARTDWTVEMALIYHKSRHPRTVPIIAKKLRSIRGHSQDKAADSLSAIAKNSKQNRRHFVHESPEAPVQLELLDEGIRNSFRSGR